MTPMEPPDMSNSMLSRLGVATLLAAAPAMASDNPMLQPWTGPYGGVPALDQYKVEQFKPALEAAMTEQLAEIDAIAANPAAPTFDNTIAAMERAGRTLDRVGTVFGVFSSTMSTPEFQAVETEMAPKLAAFGDKVTQNEKLFQRIAAVYDQRDKPNLTPEQQRLVWLDYTNFVRAGAKLDAAAKKRMSEINQRLAALFTTFSQNLLADETDYVTLLDNEADLAGLPDSLRAAAAAAAESRGHAGKWAIAQHALVDGALPDLLRPPRPAREGLAHLRQPRRQRRRARQQGAHHRDPASCAPSAPSCSATRPTPTGGSRTRWPRRPSAPWR